jgi:predicted nucleic acid-binding protein
MILVDTTVWVDHLRAGDRTLEGLLDGATVLIHPIVIGEIALGHLSQRQTILHELSRLPKAVTASDSEALEFIDRHQLFGLGIGYIDVHLLASVRLTGATLWTRDKRLHDTAALLGLAMPRP